MKKSKPLRPTLAEAGLYGGVGLSSFVVPFRLSRCDWAGPGSTPRDRDGGPMLHGTRGRQRHVTGPPALSGAATYDAARVLLQVPDRGTNSDQLKPSGHLPRGPRRHERFAGASQTRPVYAGSALHWLHEPGRFFVKSGEGGDEAGRASSSVELCRAPCSRCVTSRVDWLLTQKLSDSHSLPRPDGEPGPHLQPLGAGRGSRRDVQGPGREVQGRPGGVNGFETLERLHNSEIHPAGNPRLWGRDAPRLLAATGPGKRAVDDGRRLLLGTPRITRKKKGNPVRTPREGRKKKEERNLVVIL